MIGVHGNEWDPCARQRSRPAVPGEQHALIGLVTAIEIDILVRPEHAHGRYGLTIIQQRLIFLVPAHQWQNGIELPAVLLEGADVMPPGRDPARVALDHPVARLQRWVGGLAKGLRPAHIGRHALRDLGIPAQHAMQQLAADGVVLESGLAPRLLVRHHDAGALAHGPEIAKRQM